MTNLRYSNLTKAIMALLFIVACLLGLYCYQNSVEIIILLKTACIILSGVLFYNLANAREKVSKTIHKVQLTDYPDTLSRNRRASLV